MNLDQSTFGCSCPHCDTPYTLTAGSAGRSTCVNCMKRFLISDLGCEMDALAKSHAVCEIRNSARKYSYTANKVDQKLAKLLMGSSSTIGDEVYVHAWLVSDGEKIDIQVSGHGVGVPHRSVTLGFLEPSTYSSSPFDNRARCALKTVGKFVVLRTAKETKRKLMFCLFEAPDVMPETEIDSTNILATLRGVRGSFQQDFASFGNVSIEECVAFFDDYGNYAPVIRHEARSNPAGAKYFAHYDEFSFRKQCEWTSNDNRYRVKFAFDHRQLEVKKVFFSNTPPAPEAVWLTDPPKKVRRKFEGSRTIPLIWKNWGRTACFQLTPEDQHVPVEPFDTEFFHFWTDMVVFENVVENGTTSIVFGSNTALKPVFDSLEKGDELALEPEPYNMYDPKALAVMTSGGAKIGYLRKQIASEINDAKANSIAIIDDCHEFNVRLLLCVSSNSSLNRERLREYAQRVYDAYPDPNW